MSHANNDFFLEQDYNPPKGETLTHFSPTLKLCIYLEESHMTKRKHAKLLTVSREG